uniref:SUEL-type lectin domain-containing protein n=1 Tax=Rhodnius prolixus TaxID=13249 RepID=T1HA13_RHOPR
MLSAFYGQREGWYCNEGRESYTTCEADNPLQLTENWCNQKQECTLKASSRVFKDPCPDVKKYLEVYYVCTQDGWKELACPDDTMKLSCPKGFVIDLQSVFYGRRNTYWCGGGSSDFCEVQNAFTVVKKMCNLKQKCSIMAASVSTFGDECPNIRKYLEVIYKCVKNEEFKSYFRKGIIVKEIKVGGLLLETQMSSIEALDIFLTKNPLILRKEKINILYKLINKFQLENVDEVLYSRYNALYRHVNKEMYLELGCNVTKLTVIYSDQYIPLEFLSFSNKYFLVTSKKVLGTAYRKHTASWIDCENVRLNYVS